MPFCAEFLAAAALGPLARELLPQREMGKQRGMRVRWGGSILLAAAIGAAPKPARACSGCQGELESWPAGGSIPANTAALYLQVPGSVIVAPPPFDSGNLRLLRTGSAEPIAFELRNVTHTDPNWRGLPNGFSIRPNVPFEAGSEYTLAVTDTCGAPSQQQSFTFVAAAASPLPSTLGVVRASAQETMMIATPESNSCSVWRLAAVRALTLELSPEAMPWKDALQVQTWVDGSLVSHATRSLAWGTTHRGSGAISLLCQNADGGTPEGSKARVHSVTMRAKIPDGDWLETSPPTTVELACPEVDAGSPDAGSGGTAGDGGTGVGGSGTGGSGTGGTAPVGTTPGGASGATHAAVHNSDESAGGCSVSTPSSQFGAIGGLALLLLGVAARRRCNSGGNDRELSGRPERAG